MNHPNGQPIRDHHAERKAKRAERKRRQQLDALEAAGDPITEYRCITCPKCRSDESVTLRTLRKPSRIAATCNKCGHRAEYGRRIAAPSSPPPPSSSITTTQGVAP